MLKQQAFTLLELMVTVVIIAILAAIAYPSYTRYIEKKDLAVARQEAQHIATELERFKAKNFSYKGFDATYLYNAGTITPYDKATGSLLLPLDATTTNAKYILTLLDGTQHLPLSILKDSDDKETADSAKVQGLNWVIIVQRAKDSSGEPKQANNYDLLINSDGFRCMTKVKNVVSGYVNCGSNSEVW
ncbi:Type II secretion system protein G [Acinetobacter calcoaceticus]|jgi:type IV pilus assembly protein PilE|nr:Type II secretion system protein G [Acinetobacter calcoaceticus]